MARSREMYSFRIRDGGVNALNPAQDKHKTLGEREREEVREQLDQLLASPISTRASGPLFFCGLSPSDALAGDVSNLKERTLDIMASS